MDKEFNPDIVFKGLKGEILSLNNGYLELINKSGSVVINQASIIGYYCAKAKENYKIRLYSNLLSATMRNEKDALPVIVLNNTDKERFVAAIKDYLRKE